MNFLASSIFMNLCYNLSMTKCLPHYQGAVIGAAIGDALGFILEKQPISEVKKFIFEFTNTKKYYLTHRTFPQEFKFGQYSDDTQFSTILISHLLKHNDFIPKEYFKELTLEFKKGTLVGLGRNTRTIFKAALKEEDLTPLIANSSNGSLMRTYPLGLFFSSKEKIISVSKMNSLLTHATDESIDACALLALSINHVKDHPLSSLPSLWQDLNSSYLNWEYLYFPLEKARSYIHELSPSAGWEFVTPSAKSTLAAVMYVVSKNLSFEKSILLALSLGGDTDSVASIVGALIGFNHGVSAIPTYWQNIVHDNGTNNQDYLKDLATRLFEQVK